MSNILAEETRKTPLGQKTKAWNASTVCSLLSECRIQRYKLVHVIIDNELTTVLITVLIENRHGYGQKLNTKFKIGCFT